MGNRKLTWLKIITTILPAFFIVLLAYAILWLHPAQVIGPGYILGGVSGVAVASTYFFSRFVFGIVERSERELRQRNRELQTINVVAQALGQPQRLEEILDITLNKVLEVTSIEAGIICLLDEEQQEMVHTSFKGLPQELLGPLCRIKLAEERVGSHEVGSGDSITIHDLTENLEVREKAEKYGFASVVSLPLKYESRVLGVMALASHNPRSIEPSELRFLSGIGVELGMAIANTRLYNQVQKLAVEKERVRIAREMHDGLAQLLGYINTKILAVRKLLSQEELIQADKQLQQMEEAAREAYADVREGVLGLKTTTTERGLVATLQEYVQKFGEQSGVETSLRLDHEDSLLWLGPASEVQIVRVVQEALTNVRKHARAKQAWVKINSTDGQLTITVEDNGVGFEPGRMVRKGQPRFGLQTMKERVEAIRGNFGVESNPGKGTKVLVTIPRHSEVMA